MSERVKWIRAGYQHFETTETDRLLECIDVLVKRVGHERVNAWKALIAGGDWDAFVQDILEEHYDSAYAAAAARSRPQPRSPPAVSGYHSRNFGAAGQRHGQQQCCSS